MDKKDKKKNRRNFLKNGLTVGGSMLAIGMGPAIAKDTSGEGKSSGEKIKVLTTDGKVIEVDKPVDDCRIDPCEPPKGNAARQGIPGRSFVMVIDLARCKNARKCIEGCQKGHNLRPDQEWLNVILMKDHEEGEPYWFPRQCFHCDIPPCVKVCPVGATYKRQDNIVLVDSDRCIGCKFCMAACPYSARIFNWEKPPESEVSREDYSPEASVPAQIGTVSKCDFCPDRSREGKLPYCASGCPMGAIYFGDKNEDAVSNGTETVRFTQLIKDRVGYRYLDELGTEPNVYYLPPVERMFDYKSGLNDLTEEKKEVYKDIIDGENQKTN
jgi:molybdopterin-containing oxidoreductase family iron-sulfur binding subunit